MPATPSAPKTWILRIKDMVFPLFVCFM
jgi:hypothetical protein